MQPGDVRQVLDRDGGDAQFLLHLADSGPLDANVTLCGVHFLGKKQGVRAARVGPVAREGDLQQQQQQQQQQSPQHSAHHLQPHRIFCTDGGTHLVRGSFVHEQLVF